MLDYLKAVVGKRQETFGTKPKQKPKEKTKQNTSGLPKPYPSDAPRDMHESYFNKYEDSIKKLYADQGIELPDYFNSAESYADYRKSQKAYGGRTQQPRGAYRSAETR
jgi:hypothetical protein